VDKNNADNGQDPKIFGFRFNLAVAKGISWDKFFNIYKDTTYNNDKDYSQMSDAEKAEQKDKLQKAFDIINPPPASKKKAEAAPLAPEVENPEVKPPAGEVKSPEQKPGTNK
jgi:hypothetical protein